MAKRLAAAIRDLSARTRLTVASGQPSARDVYWGKITSMRTARMLMKRRMMTVNVGLGAEKSVRRDV